MPTARSVVIAIAMSCVATGTVASAAGPRSTVERDLWHIVGNHTAKIKITVRTPLPSINSLDTTVRSSGSYAGFLLRDSPVAGVLRVKSWHLPGASAVVLASTDRGLAPGRYVLTLIADGPTKITIPVASESRTIRPARRQRVFVATKTTDVTANSVTGAPVSAGSLEMPRGTYALALVAQSFSVHTGTAGNGGECFSPNPLCGPLDSGCQVQYTDPAGSIHGVEANVTSPLRVEKTIYAAADHEDVATGGDHRLFVLALPARRTLPSSGSSQCSFSRAS